MLSYEAKLPPGQKINEQSAQGTLEQFIRDKYDGKRWFDASAVPAAAPSSAPAQHFAPAPAAALMGMGMCMQPGMGGMQGGMGMVSLIFTLCSPLVAEPRTRASICFVAN